MTYDTMNPVPSDDPRDLDDNAKAFDRFLQSSAASEPDRLGVERKTWAQMEADAEALVSPNVSALAALVSAANKLGYFTGSGAMALTDFTAQARQLLDDTSFAAMLVTLGAAPVASPTLTGVPVAPTAAPGMNTTQLATTAFVEAARVILAAADALKAPLASPALTGTPSAPTPAVGVNTTQLATAAMIQAEIANKRAWTSFATVLTATAGTYTSASATMKYMVAFGICHIQAVITVTTKGTGASPVLTLPVTALSPAASMPIPARENLANGKSGVMSLNAGGTQGTVVASDNTNLITGDGCIVYINGSYPIA